MGWMHRILEKALPKQAMRSSAEPVRQAVKLVKTGEQTGKLADPQGKRVYHEYFVGEDRGDGHFPWSTRVYTVDGLHSEKNGLAASAAVARQQADNWGLAVKAQILGAV